MLLPRCILPDARKRNWIPRSVACVVAFSLAWFTGVAVSEAAKPNIILVMSDDVGYGDFGCHGNPVIATPSVDRFFAQSVRFTDFHVSPTCAPTRSALMTGRHEFKNGVTHTVFERERLTLNAVTVAQTLKSGGYATGVFGKWHLGDEEAYQPGQRGFDESFVHGAGGIGQTFPGSCGDAPGNTNFNPAILHNGQFEKTAGYCTDVFFDEAMKWMDQRRQAKQPFFAYITPNAAHSPHDVPDKWTDHYRGKVPDETAKFLGMVENIDFNFGRLLDRLDEWRISDDTLVIFMTDNGGTDGVPICNGGRRAGKGTPYQGGTRVPSLWRWPNHFRAGQDVSALAAHIDIFPTLCELAAIPIPEQARQQVEGRSLAPLLNDPSAAWPDRYFVTHVGRWPWGRAAEWKFQGCSIRNSRFTLVNNKELFDLQADPAESRNVFDNYPDAVSELRAAYDKWWSDVQPLLVNEMIEGPRVNPFKKRYWKQFGGGPTPELLEQMDPAKARDAQPARARQTGPRK